MTRKNVEMNHRVVSWIWVCSLATMPAAWVAGGRSVGAADAQAGVAKPAPAVQVPAQAPIQAQPGRSAGDGRSATEGRPGGRSGGPGMTWDWWNDADVKRQLGLTDEKVKRIGDFYEARAKALKPFVDEFTKQSAELDKMTRTATADEATYSLQVWRVESLRSKLQESRTMMLYRIFRELQPEQYKKLQDIIDSRFNRGRGRGPEPGR